MRKSYLSTQGISKIAIVSLLVIIVAISAIAAYFITAQQPAAKKTVVIGSTYPLETSFDPAIGWGLLDLIVQRHCYDMLIELKEPDLELAPGLATSWEMSPDATQFTFTLRQGVTFHDGTPVNATAVKFSIERSQRIQSLQYYYTSIVKEVEVLDTYTVRITLNYPYSGFLYELTWTAFAVVNPTLATEKGDDWFYDHTAGSGRFVLKEYVKGEKAVFEANKNHWDPPKVDEVIYKIYPDTASLRIALEAGEVDAIYGDIPPDDIKDLQDNPNFNIYQGGQPICVYMCFGFRAADAYSLPVRKALAYAMDIEAAVQQVFKGTSAPLYSLIPTSMWTYTPVFERYTPRNVTKAKELLAEAGFPEGITIDVYTDSQYTYRTILLQVIKEQVAEADITLNIHPLETSAFYDLCYKGEAPIGVDRWGPSYPDPDEIIGGLLQSESSASMGYFYNNSRVDELLIEERSTPNETRREEIFIELQEINAEDIAYLPLFQYVDRIIAWKYVTGLTDLYVRYPIWFQLISIEK
jgi:peptide/nickel transport system substrate-binding protein